MEDTTRLTGPWIFLAALRFAAELGMLAALAYVGWRSADGGLPGIVLAVALPMLAGSVWGRWVAPRASKRLTDPVRLAVELALLGLHRSPPAPAWRPGTNSPTRSAATGVAWRRSAVASVSSGRARSMSCSIADRFNNVLGVPVMATLATEAGATGPPTTTNSQGIATNFVAVQGYRLPLDVDPDSAEGEWFKSYDSGCGSKTHNPRDGLSSVIVSASGEEGFVDGSNGKPANRKSERMARRELLYTVVRDCMGKAGVVSASYKFKVLSLDARGRQFLVMVDLAREYGTETTGLAEIEAMIAQSATFASVSRVSICTSSGVASPVAD